MKKEKGKGKGKRKRKRKKEKRGVKEKSCFDVCVCNQDLGSHVQQRPNKTSSDHCSIQTRPEQTRDKKDQADRFKPKICEPVHIPILTAISRRGVRAYVAAKHYYCGQFGLGSSNTERTKVDVKL